MTVRRLLTALTLAVLAMTGLSACQTKVGQAAAVNGTTLSDSDLTGYIKAGAVPYNDSQGNRVLPKLYVIENWVRVQLLRAAISNKGGDVTTPELNAARSALLGNSGIAVPEASFIKLGYTRALGDLVVDQSSLVVVLIERIAPGIGIARAIQALQQGSAGSALIKAVNAAKAKVVVSRRYGVWDPNALTVSIAPGSGAPDFVHFGGGTSTLTP